MRFSKEIKDSPTLKLSELAREKIKSGINVINLAIGEPDFKTPKFVIDGVMNALNEGYTGYSSARGLIELREQISLDFKKRYNANYNTNQILILPGAKMSIYISLASILEPNDEVIIISPFYVSYEPIIKLAEFDSKIIDIPLNEDFSLPIDKIKNSINKNTKALILNYPNNPTGMLLSREEMDLVVKLVLENNIYLLSDEIYDKLILSDEEFISFSEYSELKDNLILINGYSKTHAMTGFRIGYVLSNESLITKMNLINQNINTNTNTFVQRACLSIYENDDSHILKYNELLKERLDYLHEAINNINYLSGIKPKGGFYYFINISKTNLNSTDFSNLLLEKYNVATTPGISFGKKFDNFIRISLSVDIKIMEEAIKILKNINFK